MGGIKQLSCKGKGVKALPVTKNQGGSKMNEEIRLALLENLMKRFEVQSSKQLFYLKGSITLDELESLEKAIMAYRRFIVNATDLEDM